MTLGEGVARFFAFRDLRSVKGRDLLHDVAPALAVTFLSVPQGVAYALIAGLPPAMGLYAAAFPAIIGSLFRSSVHVVTGPTNALSLLVGTVIAAHAESDPVIMAATLAVVTGALQLAAGLLRLGTVTDYISTPVVLGYITGAGTLIGVGQLHNVTATTGERGNLFHQLFTWTRGLEQTHVLSVALALGTVALLVLLKRIDRRIPGAIVVMALGILMSFGLGLSAYGVVTVADVARVPKGLPPFTLPDGSQIASLGSAALACMVLSFVESSSVARAVARETGQKLDTSAEFSGQGLANLAAGLSGAFVTSGSLTRSALNHRSGARTRLSGALSGVFMILVLLVLGPIVDYTPIAVLAGLLLVVAVGLVDLGRIRRLLLSSRSDAAAFLGTLVATWVLSLDQAIGVGVAISIVLFLRRARLLSVRELSPDETGQLAEFRIGEGPGVQGSPIRFIHLAGSLFFGAAGELRDSLDEVVEAPGTKVVVLRMKRTHGIDFSTAEALAAFAARMREHDQHLLLVGVSEQTRALLVRAGLADVIGLDHIILGVPSLFEAAARAVRKAVELVDDERVHHDPLVVWANRRGPASSTKRVSGLLESNGRH